MKTHNQYGLGLVVLLAGVCLTVPMSPANAESDGPPRLSTNPGNHVIFPAKGQTAEQQAADQLAAYNWATEQTHWDPYKAYDELVKKGYAVEEGASATKGQAVAGAARGALLGVAIGAIAGDAGEGAAIGATAGGLTQGMRGRKARKSVDSGMQAAEAAYHQRLAVWDKHFVAAMEGKGYTVK